MKQMPSMKPPAIESAQEVRQGIIERRDGGKIHALVPLGSSPKPFEKLSKSEIYYCGDKQYPLMELMQERADKRDAGKTVGHQFPHVLHFKGAINVVRIKGKQYADVTYPLNFPAVLKDIVLDALALEAAS